MGNVRNSLYKIEKLRKSRVIQVFDYSQSGSIDSGALGLSQPLLVPFNNVGHFSILTRITSANPSHSAMLTVSSPYRGPVIS